MKRFYLLALALTLTSGLYAKSVDCDTTDAATLNLFNKLLVTKGHWQRMDVEKYPGMTKVEMSQGRACTGLAVCFETDSRYLAVLPEYKYAPEANANSNAINMRGFDLYILKDGKWMWAADVACPRVPDGKASPLINNMPEGTKKCILYCPSYSELGTLRILSEKGHAVIPADPGFKGRICVFGSSYTNASGCSRPGMAYVAQLTRNTGWNFINMGFSGNSKLQQYFATALLEADDVDAYVFDAFSNPDAKMIKERLFPFIERFQAEKPGVPLIFMKTAWREKRRFDEASEKKESAKMAMADSLMRIAVRKYKDVYWIDSTKTFDKSHEWTSDGVHPDDHGYYLWAESVRKPIDRILRKYYKK